MSLFYSDHFDVVHQKPQKYPDFKYGYYNFMNPQLWKDREENGKIGKELQKKIGQRMEEYTSLISTIGDPIEATKEKTGDLLGPLPNNPAPGPAVGDLLGPLPKQPVEDVLEPIDLDQLAIEEAQQKFVDELKARFLQVVKEYRTNIEKGVKPSVLTANFKKNDIIMNGEEVYIVHDTKSPNTFWIDIGSNPKGSWRLSDGAVIFLFAAENIQQVIALKRIDFSTVVDFAILMEKNGLLALAGKNNVKANYLRTVLESDEAKKLLASVKGKGKGKAISSSGKGFDRTKAIRADHGQGEANLKRLEVLIAERENGNDSHELKKEIFALLDKIHASKLITRQEYADIIKSLNLS